jgi:hypothetical protein
MAGKLVGVIGFEPTASCTPCRRATGLRHTPTETITVAQKTRPLQYTLSRPAPASRCYNYLSVEQLERSYHPGIVRTENSVDELRDKLANLIEHIAGIMVRL